MAILCVTLGAVIVIMNPWRACETPSDRIQRLLGVSCSWIVVTALLFLGFPVISNAIKGHDICQEEVPTYGAPDRLPGADQESKETRPNRFNSFFFPLAGCVAFWIVLFGIYRVAGSLLGIVDPYRGRSSDTSWSPRETTSTSSSEYRFGPPHSEYTDYKDHYGIN